MVRKAKLRTGTALGALMALGAVAGCGQSSPGPHDTAPGPRASHSASPPPAGAAHTGARPRRTRPRLRQRAPERGQDRRAHLRRRHDGRPGRARGSGERFDHPELIASLRRLKVPATVFMTGRWAEEYPDQARAIGADPLFEIANHSYSHHAFTGDCYGLPRVAESEMRADVERAYTAFRTAGVKKAMPYFRFPGGCYDDAALREVSAAGVTAVQWDVVSGDAFATDADAVAQQVLDGVRPGSVVVMHCTRSAAPTTERALRRIVPALRERDTASSRCPS
ncbi:polysaccharide deacetylase family protein [Actinomadura keratinilytica]